MENCRLSNGESKKSKVSCSSPISILTDELLIEILCRLGSSKYALQCKSVSKLWRSLVNTDSRSSYFMRQWNRIKEEDELPQILLVQYQGAEEQDYRHVTSYLDDTYIEEQPSFKPLNFLPEKDPICVLGTFDDLVLCEPNREDDGVYYVCNPFTEQYTALPPPTPSSDSDSETDYRAALSVYEDEGVFEFKVMNVSHDPETELTRVEIFSSEDNAWRLIDTTKHQNQINMLPGLQSQYVTYNGMMVWLVEDYPHLIGIKIDGLEHDDCCTRIIPPPLDDTRFSMRVFGGHLRLAGKVGDEFADLKLKIWELDGKNNEAWKLVHDLGLRDMKDSEDRSKLKSCLSLQGCKTDFLLVQRDVLYLSCRPEDKPDEDEDEDEDEDGDGDGDELHVAFLCDLRNRTLKKSPVFSPSWIDSYHISMPSWPSPVPPLPSFTTIEHVQ